MFVSVHNEKHLVGGTEMGEKFLRESGSHIPHSFLGYISSEKSGKYYVATYISYVAITYLQCRLVLIPKEISSYNYVLSTIHLFREKGSRNVHEHSKSILLLENLILCNRTL